jgi:hypothetical protein
MTAPRPASSHHRTPVWGRLTLGLAAPLVLACGGGLTNCGRAVHKVVPAVEELDPEYATEPIDCGEPYPTGSLRGVYIKELRCGDSITGNTAKGEKHFDESFYQAQKCTPERHGYDLAPEASYWLEVPPNTWADVVLASDCVDLDIFSANWDRKNQFPTKSHVNITQCEGDTSSRGGTITITTVNQPESHLVWVDGKMGATGNFRIDVRCHNYR